MIMKNILLTFFSLALIHTSTFSQEIEWQKCFGGSGLEYPRSIRQTTDGGYIIAGETRSLDGDVSGLHGTGGSPDMWVVKLNSSGNIAWQKCLGGHETDRAYSVQQTSDGGYIVVGETWSNDGDVSGLDGAESAWIVKLNSTGDISWQRCLGGSGLEEARFIKQTSDGGYIIAGNATSNNGDVSGNHGSNDFWVVRLNSSGEISWQNCLGGSDNDLAYSIEQTSDGGYIVAGETRSNDGDVSGYHGYTNLDGRGDAWVVKLDGSGNMSWQKCLGGTWKDGAQSIKQTSDGGYILAGATGSSDGDVSGLHGGDWDTDIWVVKLSSSGNISWQKCLGGYEFDTAYSIQQTSDGGYILSGWTQSNDGDVSGHQGISDLWVVKLSSNGSISSQKCLGGTDTDGEWANDIQQTSDGGYIVTGRTESNDGDVSGNNGALDFWVVKLTDFSTSLNDLESEPMTLYPNPSKGDFIIALDRPYSQVDIIIRNVIGETIDQYHVNLENQIKMFIDAPDGVYFIEVQADDRIETIKLVIE
jgi:hypothetical protein